MNTVFQIIEYVTKSQLQNTSKHLIINYLEEAHGLGYAGKAREVIKRYTREDLPSLEEIRSKGSPGNLDPLDHLVLKMEYEAKQTRV